MLTLLVQLPTEIEGSSQAWEGLKSTSWGPVLPPRLYVDGNYVGRESQRLQLQLVPGEIWILAQMWHKIVSPGTTGNFFFSTKRTN